MRNVRSAATVRSVACRRVAFTFLLYKIREPGRAVHMESWTQCESCGGNFDAFVADRHVTAVIMVRFYRARLVPESLET